MLLMTDRSESGFQQEEAIAVLSALAQQTRLDLVKLLVNAGAEGLTAGAIASRLRVAPASLSFHFRQLVGAGLLRQHRRSRFIYYTVDRNRVRAMLGFLGDWCGALGPDWRGFEP